MTPVSYTHLDVYKRQVPDETIARQNGEPDKARGIRRSADRQLVARGPGGGNTGTVARGTPGL